MSDLHISKINEIYSQVQCENGISAELGENFTFDVPGAKFSPKFKNKVWDGKIRLFNRLNNRIYTGLIPNVVQYGLTQNYTVSYAVPNDFIPQEFSIEEAKQFIASLNLPSKIEVRYYQLEALVHAVRHRRALLISPTASGKSLVMYLILMYYITRRNLKTNLVIVPNVGLVKQLASDFVEYNCPFEIQQIHFGTERLHKPIIITTWQTAKNLPKKWFDPFNLVIGDEAHVFKAKSLIGIMDNLVNCTHRFGLTGTLDGAITNKLVLEGLFGSVKTLATTRELQDKGFLAQLQIKVINLFYPNSQRLAVRDMEYEQEIDFLNSNADRSKFIRNLALSLEGNTILLFRKRQHGKDLYEQIKLHATNRNVYFVDGKIESEVREQIRKLLETEKNAIAVVSYGTFSQGINIVNLNNVIFGSPSKQRVRVLQSIGRVLRTGSTKTTATLYDIVDDLSWEGRKIKHDNFMVEHFKERVALYKTEQFPYKIYNVALNG